MRSRTFWRAMTVAVVGVGLSVAVLATPSALDRKAAMRMLDDAKKDLSAGRLEKTIDGLTTLLTSLRATAPLRVPRVVVVEKPAGGLLKFTPTLHGRVTGRNVQLYVEIENARGRPLVDGQHEVALEVTGAFRFENEEIGERTLGVHRDVWREVPAVLAIGLDFALADKAPAGVYTLTLKVTDTVAATRASAETRFELR